jgi:hypothetical protein
MVEPFSDYSINKGPTSSSINWVNPAAETSNRPSFNSMNLRTLEHEVTGGVTPLSNLPQPDSPTSETDAQQKLEEEKWKRDFRSDAMEKILQGWMETHRIMRELLLALV